MSNLILAGAVVTPLASGALWWDEKRLLAVGDLHLGRAERTAREGGSLLPPYETQDTLDRLDALIGQHHPQTIVLLGDSFDDMHAARDLSAEVTSRVLHMAAGRRLIWVAGNHDPGPVDLPGTHQLELTVGPLIFRHAAAQDSAPGEISAHYHPKTHFWVKGTRISRPCFLADMRRMILPAFGTYTGGLDVRDPAFNALFGADAMALLTGQRISALPRAAILHQARSQVRPRARSFGHR